MTLQNQGTAVWASVPVDRVAAPLRAQVIQTLKSAILNFQLRPGQRLVERELIEQLGVSRTTVREALRELTSEGLVTVVPQRGAIVTAPPREDAEDLYEIRAVLESLLVERFVERASDERIDELGAAVERFAETTAGTSDIRTLLDAKDLFYEVLLAGAESPVLTNLIEGLQARVRLLRATSLGEPGRAETVANELRQIVVAAKARDARTAADRCAAHVRTAAITALKSLDEQVTIDPS